MIYNLFIYNLLFAMVGIRLTIKPTAQYKWKIVNSQWLNGQFLNLPSTTFQSIIFQKSAM